MKFPCYVKKQKNKIPSSWTRREKWKCFCQVRECHRASGTACGSSVASDTEESRTSWLTVGSLDDCLGVSSTCWSESTSSLIVGVSRLHRLEEREVALFGKKLLKLLHAEGLVLGFCHRVDTAPLWRSRVWFHLWIEIQPSKEIVSWRYVRQSIAIIFWFLLFLLCSHLQSLKTVAVPVNQLSHKNRHLLGSAPAYSLTRANYQTNQYAFIYQTETITLRYFTTDKMVLQ